MSPKESQRTIKNPKVHKDPQGASVEEARSRGSLVTEQLWQLLGEPVSGRVRLSLQQTADPQISNEALPSGITSCLPQGPPLEQSPGKWACKVFRKKRVKVGCREVPVASVCVLGVEVVCSVSGEELLPGHPSSGRQGPLGGQSACVFSCFSRHSSSGTSSRKTSQHPG